MIELIATEDLVLLSYLRSRLGDLGIACVVFDDHTTSAYAGALPAVQRRIMVADADIGRARQVLAEAVDSPGARVHG